MKEYWAREGGQQEESRAEEQRKSQWHGTSVRSACIQWDVFYVGEPVNALYFFNYFPIRLFISSFIWKMFSKYITKTLF